MTEDTLGSINKGKTAQITLDWVSPIFNEQKEKLLIDLKNLYRGGKATEGNLLAVASGLCTIDDIEGRLKRVVRQGSAAAEEMINERNATRHSD